MCICLWPQFDCPEVTLCGIKIQLLLILSCCSTLSASFYVVFNSVCVLLLVFSFVCVLLCSVEHFEVVERLFMCSWWFAFLLRVPLHCGCCFSCTCLHSVSVCLRVHVCVLVNACRCTTACVFLFVCACVCSRVCVCSFVQIALLVTVGDVRCLRFLNCSFIAWTQRSHGEDRQVSLSAARVWRYLSVLTNRRGRLKALGMGSATCRLQHFPCLGFQCGGHEYPALAVFFLPVLVFCFFVCFRFVCFVLFCFVCFVLLLFFNLRRGILFHYCAVPFEFPLFAAIWTSVDCRWCECISFAGLWRFDFS